MLGEQFEDTYWHEGGDVKASVKGRQGSPRPWVGSLQEGQQAREQAKAEYKVGDPPSPTPPEPGLLQGMLFSPHAGTQTSRDPLLRPGEYRDAAKHALGYGPDRSHFVRTKETVLRNTTTGRQTPYSQLSDEHKAALRENSATGRIDIDGDMHYLTQASRMEEIKGDAPGAYMEAASKAGRGVNRQKAAGEIEELADAVEKTDIPMHELKNTPPRGVTTFVKKSGAWYQPDTGNIMINRSSRGVYLSDSIAHELGHKRDPDIDNRRFSPPDPVQEGIADAASDRSGRGAGRFDSTRREQMPIEIAHTGYSRNFAGWKSKAAKGVYTAARALSSELGDIGRDSIPDRAGLFHQATGRHLPHAPETVDVTLAHTLALGQMYAGESVVREAIRGTGLEGTAEKARKTYLEMTTPPGEQVTQDPMFTGGREGHPDPDLDHLFGVDPSKYAFKISPKAKPPKRYQT